LSSEGWGLRWGQGLRAARSLRQAGLTGRPSDHLDAMNTQPVLQVVIVEDHEALRASLADHLRGCGCAVRAVGGWVELNQALLVAVPHVVVLDLNLPDADGQDIAMRLRDTYPALGIAVMTARNKGTDRAQAYANGADVFLKKPIDTTEMEAVVLALGRRVLEAAVPTCALFVLHSGAGVLQRVDQTGARVRLSPVEARLLRVLAMAPQEGSTAEDILQALDSGLPEEAVPDIGRLRVLVHRLRAKLSARLNVADLVLNVRGVGYRLAEAVEVV
jgi:two-component system, OmpR family, response regulator